MSVSVAFQHFQGPLTQKMKAESERSKDKYCRFDLKKLTVFFWLHATIKFLAYPQLTSGLSGGK